MADLILVINPGSTSTKIALYKSIVSATRVNCRNCTGVPSQIPEEYKIKAVFAKNILHSAEELSVFPDIPSQTDYRKGLIEKALGDEGVKPEEIECIMCRGGLVQKPQISTGAYEVDEDLYRALSDPDITSPHASLLGGLIGKELADKINADCGRKKEDAKAVKAYIYDAVTSIELGDVQEITGIKEIKRNGSGHVLNARAMAMKYAEDVGKSYDRLNLIVIHTGGGSTVNAHSHGKIVDCIGDDETHMSLERSGGVPLLKFIKLCFSGKYTEKDIEKLVRGKGGMMALLGTSNGMEIEEMMKEEKGSGPATTAVKAMAYGLAKSAAALIPALGELPDAIIVTGGFAHSKTFTDILDGYLKPFGGVVVMPGEREMDALANGGLRILTGQEKAKKYTLPK